MVLTVLCFFDNDTSKFEPTQIRQRRIWRFCAKVNNGFTVSDAQNSKFIAFRTVRRDQAPPHGRRFAPDRSLLHSKAQMSSSQIIRISYVYHTQYRFLPVVILDPVSPRSYSPGRTQSPGGSLAFSFSPLQADFSAHYRNRLRSFYDILHTDVLVQRCKLPWHQCFMQKGGIMNFFVPWISFFRIFSGAGCALRRIPRNSAIDKKHKRWYNIFD